MNATRTLARFVAGFDAGALGARSADALCMHVFDSVSASVAGAGVAETLAARAMVERDYGPGAAPAIGTGVRTSLPAAALLGSISARCSEVDDIHLASCITPGSIVVPTALAAAGVIGDVDGRALLAACAAGYEILLRFGLAIDGPRILYRGLWPTYLCAGFGVVATLGRLLELNEERLADAFGTAASLALGTTGRPAAPTSRWLTLGCAVQNGVLAVRAAQQGLRGDPTLLEGRWSEITGTALDRDRLTGDLGAAFHLDELCFKPWCAAKQTIAATEAFAGILTSTGLDPNGISDIQVDVPPAYAAMIDHAELPGGRLESLASVHYQLALAAFAPERAYDVVRATALATPSIAHLMSVTHVKGDETLGRGYPSAWPARVHVRDATGTRHTREVQHPLGDPETAFGWDELERKSARVTQLEERGVREIARCCRALPGGNGAGALIAAIERA